MVQEDCKVTNLMHRRSGKPFFVTVEKADYEPPLPDPLTLLKGAVLCFLVAGLLIYMIGWGR